MEATAALGLAGNVVQFVDFSQKLCHMFLEIRNMSQGITESNADAQRCAETFLGSLGQVNADLHIYSEVLNGANGNSQLEAITKRCEHIAGELLSRLKALSVKGRPRRLKAAVATVKSMWKEDELLKILEELRKHRDELMYIIILSTRKDLSLLKSCQEDQFDRFQSTVIANLTEVIRSQLKELPIFPSTPASLSSGQSQGRSPVSNSADEYMPTRSSTRDDDVAINTSKAMAETIASKLAEDDRQILDSLDFLVMRDRENAISKAATATFDWIFRDSTGSSLLWSNFTRWLTEETIPGIYWINGKAGSGKSTLMKHLFNNRQTRDALKSWASPSKVLLAGFFFSYSGKDLQKSQEGLLRALLYACLKDHRQLIPLVVPYHDKFGRDECDNHWTLDRLKTAFRRLVSQDVSRLVALKFCFFVDGLDEYAGCHSDITSMLMDAANHSHVKICTSSRPLLTIERSLSVFPGLVLQNLTRPDIQQFVSENLNQNKEILQLETKEPGLVRSLVADITFKASGVFLWVALVVGSLLEGSKNFDEVSDLKRRLKDLPQDLGELYWHMIKRVKPQWYLEEGFRLLLLVQAAGGSLDVLDLFFHC